MTLKFTEEQIADMRDRREAGWGWKAIAIFYNVNVHVIRRNLDPLWKFERNKASLDYYKRKRDGYPVKNMSKRRLTPRVMTSHFPDRTTRTDVPQERWDELRQALAGDRTLTQEFCGDPLPGRSALDRRENLSG